MDLHDVLYKYRRKFLTLDQVVGVGLGFKEVGGKRTNKESIQVLVREKLPIEKIHLRDLVPTKIDGVPTDVIQVGRVHALGTRTERARPAQPGMSIAHYLVSAGTFGAVVYDRVTGQPLILSNNHILANNSTDLIKRASIGDAILQPGDYDGGTLDNDIIAYLERYVPIKMTASDQAFSFAGGQTDFLTALLMFLLLGQDGMTQYQRKMHRAQAENVVDCAVAFPVDQKVISDRILEVGRVAGVRRPEVGDMLYKSGRTSGLTKGRVRTVDATLNVEMGYGEEALFTDQILVNMPSEGGDSGSLVVDRRRNACGLLFAGSEDVTVCNPIDEVLRALNVRF